MVRKLFCWGMLIAAVLIAILARYKQVWLEVVVGAIISIWATALFEAIQKPDLAITRYRHGRAVRILVGPHHCHVLSLHLVNRPLPGWLANVLQRNSATETSGTITFHPLDTSQQIGQPMPIRWSNTPQPLYTVVEIPKGGSQVQKTVYNPERLTTVREIPPGHGDEGVLGVALRFDGDGECYGVTNESYVTSWRPSKWRLDPGKYLVEVKISASNARCEGTFILVNEGALPDEFRLELASRT